MAALLLCCTVGCLVAEAPADVGGKDAGADAGADGGALPERTCFPSGPGVTGSPKTIGEAVALINSLPKPTTVPCLLESLDRPLKLDATVGTLSAQPAAGARSPRIFLFLGPLIVSVVPDGRGATVVEFSEARELGLSVKGELPFPVTGTLPPEAPFTHVMFQTDLTTCALCHSQEVPDAMVGTAQSYASVAFRPLWYERVPLAKLREEWLACDETAEPARCAFYDALFSFGAVETQEFPKTMPTFIKE